MIRLVPAEVEDIDDEYLGWLSDPEINKFLVTKNPSKIECIKYIAEHRINPFKDIFWIKYNNIKIGTLSIGSIDIPNNIARIGIMIGNKEYHNKGVGTEALNIAYNLCRDKYGITRIDLGVRPENLQALKCYEKAGFKIYNVTLIKE